MKVGDKVEVIRCDIFPEFVGKIGNVVRELSGGKHFKVCFEEGLIPLYTTKNCLKKVEDHHGESRC